VQLERKLAQYRILPSDTYNMDEKGFMLGQLQKTKRYFSISEAESKRLAGAGQDGSREWVTVIASICQDGSALPPAIIYSAATNNHKDTWYEDLETSEPIAHFITSPNGWTTDDIGYQWLTDVFNRHTKQKARMGRDWRLLYLDGHSSHLNMRFLEFCDNHRIIVMAYPPHSTHRLQPLDVSLFNPLSNYYSQNLDNWVRTSHGICSMSKRYFWRLFKPAFDLSFTPENIASGWEKTGLHPFNSDVVLSQVKKSNQRPPSATSSLSAFSSSSWKRADKHFKATYGHPQSKSEKKLQKTIDNLFAKAQHQDLEITILKERLKMQDTHNKRGQTLFNELRAQEDNKALFMSPAKFQAAKAILTGREKDKTEEEQRKAQAKIEREQKKLSKQLELDQRKQERAIAKIEREEQRAAARAAREEAKAEKQREKELQEQQKIAKKEAKLARFKSQSFIANVEATIVEEDEEVLELASSTTRSHRRLPQRFRR
jgi:hypothetical protein